MKPAPFDYVRAESVEHAVTAAASRSPQAPRGTLADDASRGPGLTCAHLRVGPSGTSPLPGHTMLADVVTGYAGIVDAVRRAAAQG